MSYLLRNAAGFKLLHSKYYSVILNNNVIHNKFKTFMTRLRYTPDEIKDAIANAAVDVALNEGWRAVTARRVAEEVGYTTTIIYQHFENKKAMLRYIAENGHKHFDEEIRTALSKAGDDPATRFRALVHAYYAFAQEHFQVYQLMYEPSLYQEADTPIETASQLFTFLQNEIITLVGDRISPEDAAARVYQVWSTLHGLVAIDASHLVRHNLLNPEKVIQLLEQDFIAAMLKEKEGNV